jgi:hypothetical protein
MEFANKENWQFNNKEGANKFGIQNHSHEGFEMKIIF